MIVTTGIGENIHDEISIVPTLFDEYIKITGCTKVLRIDIISVDGRVVKRILQPNEEIISMSSIAPGMYTFLIHMENGQKAVKALKK